MNLGYRVRFKIVDCGYCGAKVGIDADAVTPAVDDEEAWAALASEHGDDCEWIATRAHRVGVS